MLSAAGRTDPLLPARLAGKVNDQVEVFASQMREGLLAASVAIGLDVMAELIEAEVTEVAGQKGERQKPWEAALTGVRPEVVADQ